MANPSVSIPDEVLDDFDTVIKQKKLAQEMDMDLSRSELITQLIQEYVEGNGNTSNGKTTPATAD